MYYLGLDIGGTTIKAGLIDEANHVLDARKAPTVVDDLKTFINDKANKLTRYYDRLHEMDVVVSMEAGQHVVEFIARADHHHRSPMLLSRRPAKHPSRPRPNRRLQANSSQAAFGV